MSNPNNCADCDHMKFEHDGLHCYMFKDAPSDVCHQHSKRREAAFEFLMIAAKFLNTKNVSTDSATERKS